MFNITEYNAPEDVTGQIRKRGIIKRDLRTPEEAETEIKRLFVSDGYKLTGYNQELD